MELHATGTTSQTAAGSEGQRGKWFQQGDEPEMLADRIGRGRARSPFGGLGSLGTEHLQPQAQQGLQLLRTHVTDHPARIQEAKQGGNPKIEIAISQNRTLGMRALLNPSLAGKQAHGY